ncbi:MAG: hypothetical protein GC192_17335 [Bacteroidetes bacterium]|nr:hypothetical protein [Bacteroidota bacterium]
MVRIPSLNRIPIPILTILMLVSTVFWCGCPSQINDVAPPPIQVNPDFEMFPPLARDVSLRVLDKPTDEGNLLIVADFGKEQIKGEFHAFFLGEEKLVLRDDGKGGDEQKGDGKFSIIIKEDLAALSAHLDSLSQKQFLNDERLSFFEGRLMKRPDVNEIREFEPKRLFEAKERFRLPPDIFHLLTPADPALKDHSLMITDPLVVEDPTRTFTPCVSGGTGTPGGIWTFGHLIREMANTPVTGVTPEAFLTNLLQTWQVPQTVNGDNIPARPGISQIINTWAAFSGGTLNVDRAPFKLIAIVNRMDLRGSSGYGLSNAGEGRFVFCALNNSCQPLRNPAPFMVIFEYGIPKKGCASVRAYAKEWHDLKSQALGSPAYNAALENITKQFTEANLGGTTKGNGSALNQLRTNELALGLSPWELREFVIDATTHQLTPTTVKQEPQTSFNQQHPGRIAGDVQILATFVNGHQLQVELDRHKIPPVEGGRNMLAGKAHTLNPTTYHWNAATVAGPDFITSDKARFHLSLNTCSGCHGGETVTNNFMHVAPGGLSGVPAQLSRFLTGNPPGSASPWVVPDRAGRPSTPATGWEFNDLERRAKDLEDFVAAPCKPFFKVPAVFKILTQPPLAMTH